FLLFTQSAHCPFSQKGTSSCSQISRINVQDFIDRYKFSDCFLSFFSFLLKKKKQDKKTPK
ncbi:MAG: hypothetical protein KH153_00615, partial [Bacteroidales bacterium]|nr:hypothetical protein [Bacteroidales bacterium]